MFLLMSWFLHITVRRVPYHRACLNIGEAALYSAAWYAAGLALLGIYYPQARCGGGRAAGLQGGGLALG